METNRKNRKQRRAEARMKRSNKQAGLSYDLKHWVQRLCMEMKESPRVQRIVGEGKLDKYLT